MQYQSNQISEEQMAEMKLRKYEAWQRQDALREKRRREDAAKAKIRKDRFRTKAIKYGDSIKKRTHEAFKGLDILEKDKTQGIRKHIAIVQSRLYSVSKAIKECLKSGLKFQPYTDENWKGNENNIGIKEEKKKNENDVDDEKQWGFFKHFGELDIQIRLADDELDSYFFRY